MGISAYFASILFDRKQIMEAQKGDIYNGELEDETECRER